jgi:hypothetical protein
MDPKDHTPTGSVDDYPLADRGSVHLVHMEEGVVKPRHCALKLTRFHEPVGWMGRDSGGWAVIRSEAEMLRLELHDDGGKLIFKVSGDESYMSVSDSAYVGFYRLENATTFHFEGKNLVSDYNGQKLSYYSADDGYLYCWDKYPALEAEVVILTSVG